jgi:hypothetical protein
MLPFVQPAEGLQRSETAGWIPSLEKTPITCTDAYETPLQHSRVYGIVVRLGTICTSTYGELVTSGF